MSSNIQLHTKSIILKFKGLVPLSVKKIFYNILVTKMFGKILKKLNFKFNLFGGYFDYSQVTDIESASIFWGFWESAEIRFSKKYATSANIIELGSSIGATLGVLANLRKNTKFICVEASEKNFMKLQHLQQQLSKDNEYILINKAIAHGVEKVSFVHSSTVSSRIDLEDEDPSNFISAITLSDILSENKITNQFCLITDIEGEEAEIFFKDEASLDMCEIVIAELEDTPSYSIDDQIEKLLSLGFNLTERYGNVVAMRRE